MSAFSTIWERMRASLGSTREWHLPVELIEALLERSGDERILTVGAAQHEACGVSSGGAHENEFSASAVERRCTHLSDVMETYDGRISPGAARGPCEGWPR